MDVVDRIAATKTGMNDKPKADQRMKKVTVETFGVDLPRTRKAVIERSVSGFLQNCIQPSHRSGQT
ncbi:MAG: hypothetical protein ACLUNZ_07950 [Evtepia sp.]